jgi:hypothetical protein
MKFKTGLPNYMSMDPTAFTEGMIGAFAISYVSAWLCLIYINIKHLLCI